MSFCSFFSFESLEVRNLNLLLKLYTTFFRIGIVMFGGGYAMMPLLQAEIVEKQKWTTNEEILNYFAVGQCTPGIIAVNTATFVGYKQKKVPGAIMATLGMVSPSIIIILLIANVLDRFADNVWVNHAFAGIRVAVCALILSSIIKLWKDGVKGKWGIVLFLISFVLVAFVDVSTIWIVIGAIVLGLICQIVREKNGPGAGNGSKQINENKCEQSHGKVGD